MDNCSNTLQQCLKLLQLKYTPDYIADALNKHNSRTFTINNMLHPNQLKTVLGGYNPGCACGHQCDSVGSNCSINGRSGTCRNGNCDGCRTRLCYA